MTRSWITVEGGGSVWMGTVPEIFIVNARPILSDANVNSVVKYYCTEGMSTAIMFHLLLLYMCIEIKVIKNYPI